ncbi:hypothetical protein ACFL2L_01220 [Patescibacteria group bacterium]
MNIKNKKPKIAIISLTSCEGCEIAVLDLGERLIKVLGNVELINFKYMMDAEVANLKGCDIAFVEGSPVNNRDIKLLKEVRKNSKKIIALGNCAHLGGVQKIKNYGDKEKIAKYVYKMYKEIENNDGSGIDKYIKIDSVIPGCPINKEEFLKCCLNVLAGREFKITENPVCYECLNSGYECLLQNGQICMGPVTIGGCDAICLKSKQACWGCRGVLPEVDVGAVHEPSHRACPNVNKMQNLKKKLQSIAGKENIDGVEEIFGVK